MKKSKVVKLFKIVILILLILITMNNIVNAAGMDFSKWWRFASDFPGASSEIDVSDLREAQTSLYNFVFYFGVIISVLIAAILGIQYITSAPEAKAEVKQKSIPYVVGMVVVFGGFLIWRIAVNVAQNVAP